MISRLNSDAKTDREIVEQTVQDQRCECQILAASHGVVSEKKVNFKIHTLSLVWNVAAAFVISAASILAPSRGPGLAFGV